jgi:phosphoglycerate dehydrogenase-like enzyme
VNKVTIDKMKKVAYIVNTAHGSLLEIDELHATLDSDKIAGVTVAVDNLLDVFK